MKNICFVILICMNVLMLKAQNEPSLINEITVNSLIKTVESEEKGNQLPKYAFGYWESKDFGLYFFKDALLMFSLPSYDSESRIFSMNSFIGSSYKGDTLRLNLFNNSKSQESITGFQFIDENHLRMFDFESPWPMYEKKSPDLYALLSILGLTQELADGTKESVDELLDKFEKLNSVPNEIQGLYEKGKRHYYIFENQVNESSKTYGISEIYTYRNLCLLISFGKRRRSPRAFLIKKTSSDLEQYKFKEYSLRSSGRNFLKPEPYLKKKGILSLEDVPEEFFQRCFPANTSIWSYDFESYMQLKKNGTLFINGTVWKLERLYSSEFHPEEHNYNSPQSYILNLEVKNTLTGEGRIMRASNNKGNIKFKIEGQEFGEYEEVEKAIGNVLFQVGGFLLFLAAIAALIHRIFILPRKLKQRLTAVQLEGIKSQLNPHFLFNSMASIQSLMNQNKILEANRYQAELSDLLRYHLDAGAEDMVLLSEELAALQHYLELENLRSPFFFSFEVDTAIDPNIIEIPNQLLQALVENAVKHGLRYADDPKLLVRVQKRAKHLCIYIIDNGPGISATKKVNEKLPTLRKTHKGLALIQEKMGILKKKGLKLKLTIKDRAEDLSEAASGTQVELEFPLRY